MTQIKKLLILSVSQKRADAQMTTITDRIQNEKRSQVSIFRAFNAKRNSAQIERYFTESSDKCHIISIFTISILLCFAIVIFLMVYPAVIIRNKVEGMTEEIVELTINDIQQIVTTEINLTYYMMNLFTSLFIPPSMINVFQINSMGMANEVSRLFYDASQLFSNLKIIKLYAAFESEGFYVGLSAKSNLIREYSSPSDPQLTTVFVFPENSPNLPSPENDMFPFIGNSDTYRDFDLTSTDWFKTARDSRRPAWTNTSDGWKIISNNGNSQNCTIGLVYATVPYFEVPTNRNPDMIMAGSVDLDRITDLLRASFQKSHIRLALLNDNSTQGELLAYTTNDEPICLTGNRPITLYDVVDPLWRAAVYHSSFESNGNFTFEYDGSEFFFVFIPFETSLGNVWSMISIYVVDSVTSGISEEIPSTSLLTLIIIFIIVSLLFVFGAVFLKYTIHMRQSKILSKTSEDKKSGHIDMKGLNPTILLLKKLLLSHADNLVIKQKVADIINDLVESSECKYANISEFYSSIEDENVRSKFIGQFGSNPSIKIKELQEPSIEDREIVAKYNQDHPFSKMFCRIMTTKDFDKKLSKIVASRVATVLYEGEIIKKKTPAMVQCFNVLNPLFDPDEFEILIGKVLKSNSELTLPLLYDSVEFMFIIAKRNIQTYIADTDYVLAAFIAIFAFHLSMNNRNDPSLPYINRYFQLERHKLSTEVYTLLYGLYQILVSNKQEHLDRWKVFSELVLKITMENITIWNMRTTIENTNYVIKEINARENKATVTEAVTLMKTLYIGGQISMFFHSRKNCYDLQNIFIPINNQNRQKSLIRFINCFIRQYVKPVSDTFEVLCGEDFLNTLKGIE